MCITSDAGVIPRMLTSRPRNSQFRWLKICKKYNEDEKVNGKGGEAVLKKYIHTLELCIKSIT